MTKKTLEIPTGSAIHHFLIVSIFVFSILWPTFSSGAAKGKAPVPSRNQEMARLIEGAKKEGKVVWRDGLKPSESTPIIKAFETKYPFIKVEHTEVHDTASREGFFREMMVGKAGVDVYDTGGEQVAMFKQAGLLEKYDWTKAFDVRPEQLEKDQMFLAIGGAIKGIGYNTNLVSQQDLPKRWEDLLDPKWKGKMVVDTRPKPFVHLMPVWGEEKVLEFLKKILTNKPRFRRGQQESVELMAAGEFPLIAGVLYYPLSRTKKRGAPVDIQFADVVPVTLSEEGIASNAPHPNAAKLFLGWLGREGQKYYDEVTSYGIPLPGFDTETSKLIKGKTLSLFTGDWVNREAELMNKALKALGRE